MPIKDLGKGLKETLQGAAHVAMDKAKDIDVGAIKENVHGAAEAVKEKAAEVGTKATGQVKKVFQKEDHADASAGQGCSAISVKCALQVIYYFMAADGEIFHGEEEKFDAIGKELDGNFDQTKEEIVSECKANLDLAADGETYAAALRSGIDQALLQPHKAEEPCITSQLLVWDLLTVAYSDENFNEKEQELLRYVVEKLHVDEAVYLELQSSILTMLDLEKELSWIKTTNRPYLTVEPHIQEIQKRKSTVMESVMALIGLQEV